MKLTAVLIFSLALASCSKDETVLNDNTQNSSNKTVAISPTVEKDISPEPITPNSKLTARQQLNLDEILPPKVRETLEKAETIEVLAKVANNADERDLKFNRIAEITDEKEKKEVLEAFYFDASHGEYLSQCFKPRYKIRAVNQGKTVEIEISFECHNFYVNSSFGKFDGGIVYPKSEDILKRIIETKGAEIKK